MTGFRSVGPHFFRIDGNLVVIHPIGVPDLESVRFVYESIEREIPAHADLYLLVNMTRVTGAPPVESRRYIAEWTARHAVRAIAYVNPNILNRAVLILMENAMRLLGRSYNFSAVFAGELEALQWLEAKRSIIG